MKRIFHSLIAPLLLALSLSTSHAAATTTAKLRLSQANRLALATYIYAYPLVTMGMTNEVMTNVAKPGGMLAPMGAFANLRNYPTPQDKAVTTPNADTLYSAAWIDLSKEPYILHVPDEPNRYYLLPLLSAWTDVFASPGTRTTGTKARDFAIVGPKWQGTLPTDMKAFKSPTNLVWIIGRTYCSGTAEDYNTAHQIQDAYTLTPLSDFGKAYTPPGGTVNTSIDMTTPVRTQVNSMNGAEFYKKFAELLKKNPPSKADAPMIETMAKLGIVPGQDFNINNVDMVIADALNASVRAGQKKILAHQKKSSVVRNGWSFNTETGTYGTNYLQRALIAYIGLGANLQQDAIYPSTSVDTANVKLNGANRYTIHFTKDQMPPVKGFWSLTMYDPSFFFVPNSLNKYTLSMRDKLKTNEDGSIDLYIQHNSPGADKESNWLPAPSGDFVLVLRLYWPEDSVIDGKWYPPGVNRIL